MRKLEQLQEIRTSARLQLEHALHTNRGTTEAREEAKRVLQQSLESCRCQSCGSSLTLHPKMNGYCRTCNARFDRLLNFKSKIKREAPREKALRSFINDYASSEVLPYALRGNAPKAQIIQYATDLLNAIVEINNYIKETLTNAN